MNRVLRAALFGLAMTAGVSLAAAQVPQTPGAKPTSQTSPPATSVPFAGGALTITETPDLDKVLAFDGEELQRNYVLFYDRTVEVAGEQVALFEIGDGGNACGTSVVLVWKGSEGVESALAGFEDECDSPPAALTQDKILFVPYLRPGQSSFVQSWTPKGGFTLAGEIYFAPQAETTWADIDVSAVSHPYDLLSNEDVYNAAEELLGDDLEHLSLGLSTAGGPEVTESGVIYVSGCVPHACGAEDGFLAIDPKKQQIYAAQKSDDPALKTWPDLAEWPADVHSVMKEALGQ